MKKRPISILLINPAHEEKNSMSHIPKKVHRDVPPYFALRISAYLKEKGIDVDLLDTHLEEDYIGALKNVLVQKQYMLIGFTSCLGSIMRNAAELTQVCKEIVPDIPIVWGGAAATAYPEDVLLTYKPDYVVRFEGEQTLYELINALDSGNDLSGIKGLSYLKGDDTVHHGLPRLITKDGLNSYPIPDWSLLGDKINKEQMPYIAYMCSSHGCPFSCTFCYHQNSDHPKSIKWQCRSFENLMAEVNHLHDTYGITVFSFGDDNFLTDRKRAIRIFEEFKKCGFYIEGMAAHLNLITDPVADAMAGVVGQIDFGIESASQELLKMLNKKLDISIVEGVVEKLFNRGINCQAYFIIGLPQETDDDLRANFLLSKRLREINPFIEQRSFFFMPIPKTPIFHYQEQFYNCKLPSDLKTFENYIDSPLTETDFPKARIFHPGLSKSRFEMLQGYFGIYMDLFKFRNLKEKNLALLKENVDLARIFEGYEDVRVANNRDFDPYILNKIIAGQEFDLQMDLQTNA